VTRIQHSIEINVPVHIAYNQLTQFEEYPRFMQDIEAVRRLDDAHLHWSERVSDQPMEWDAEITERRPDHCIAWRNVSGLQNTGKVELQPVGQERARVTFTMEREPSQISGSPESNNETEMAQRVEQDLERLKQLIETRNTEAGQPSAEVPGKQAIRQDRDVYGKTQGDPLEDAVRRVADGQQDASESRAQSAQQSQARAQQADPTTQSAASLSRSSDDQAEDGRFSIAEEQNFDQQSEQARRVGQMPEDVAGPGMAGVKPSDAMGKSMKQGETKPKE
jgi:hypothetical protein